MSPFEALYGRKC
jgi:hypothetical protein